MTMETLTSEVEEQLEALEAEELEMGGMTEQDQLIALRKRVSLS